MYLWLLLLKSIVPPCANLIDQICSSTVYALFRPSLSAETYLFDTPKTGKYNDDAPQN